MKEEKGITLVSLVLIVIVLLILAGVTVQTGTESIDSTRLQGFYTELEIIQKRVEDISATNETYVDNEGNVLYLSQEGSNLTDDQKNSLQTILETQGIEVGIENFRYFTFQDLKNKLDLLDMRYNVFIDFENKIVVAEEGIKIGDKSYHILSNPGYIVEQNINKNTGEIENLTYNVGIYSDNRYKVTVIQNNTIGDLEKTGYVKFKKTTTKYWETSSNNEIILELGVEYNIVYIDLNNNKIEKVIRVEMNNEEVVTVTEI